MTDTALSLLTFYCSKNRCKMLPERCIDRHGKAEAYSKDFTVDWVGRVCLDCTQWQEAALLCPGYQYKPRTRQEPRLDLVYGDTSKALEPKVDRRVKADEVPRRERGGRRRRLIHKFTCEHCGKESYSDYKEQRFCSNSCSMRARGAGKSLFDKAKALGQTGMSYTDIGRKLGVSPSGLQALFKRFGYVKPVGRKRMDDAPRDSAGRRLIHELNCQNPACGKTFRTAEKVQKYCSQECAGKCRPARVSFDEAVTIYESGLSMRDTARALSCTTTSLQSLFKRRGYKGRAFRKPAKYSHTAVPGTVYRCEVCGREETAVDGKELKHFYAYRVSPCRKCWTAKTSMARKRRGAL